MRTIGALRKVDEAGRIVLPKDLRKKLLLLEDNDYVEIYTDGDEIILRRHTPSCIFCKCDDNLIEFEGKRICKDCVAKMAEQAKA